MKEFESLKVLGKYLKGKKTASNLAIQSLDLTLIEPLILSIKFSKCLLLGCVISDKIWHHLYAKNYIFPTLDLPYHAYPNTLYSKETLYNGYDYHLPASYDQTLDKIVYDHFIKTGKQTTNLKETLCRSLHDHRVHISNF